MEIENVLFDFNGTIVDDLDLCLDLLNKMLVLRNHLPVNKEKYLEIFEFPVIEYYKKAGFIFPQDNFAELADFFIKEYEERNKDCSLQTNIIEILEYLKKLNKNLYIVSASEKMLLKNQLRKYNIDQYFLDISGTDNINATSKIESSQKFVKEKKLNLNKTVFIGDTLHDKEVADNLGIKCILFSRGHQSRHRLETSNCLVIDDFLELKKIIK